MAELTTLARPYAKAAFEHAQAHQQLANWSAMLGLAAAVSQDDTMQRVLKAPRLTSAEKAATFIDVCGDKFDAKAQNFINVVAENDRLPLLPEIAALFDLYKAEQEKSVDVEVTSAFALNQEQQDKLAKVLSARLNREVRLQVEEDSSLIGGVVIRAGATAMRELAGACEATALGCTQATEIRYTPGLALVGPLPAWGWLLPLAVRLGVRRRARLLPLLLLVLLMGVALFNDVVRQIGPALSGQYEAHQFIAFRGSVKSYRDQLQVSVPGRCSRWSGPG